MLIPKVYGRGPYLQPNGFVVVTTRRVLAGQRPVLSKRPMILYMLYAGRAPGDEANMIAGGMFKRGYETLVVEPGLIERVLDTNKRYVELTVSPGLKSSINVKAFRIYTDKASSFRLPPASEAASAI
jgi:hypothetical protein